MSDRNDRAPGRALEADETVATLACHLPAGVSTPQAPDWSARDVAAFQAARLAEAGYRLCRGAPEATPAPITFLTTGRAAHALELAGALGAILDHAPAGWTAEAVLERVAQAYADYRQAVGDLDNGTTAGGDAR